jgi:hypothetical protein
MRQRAALCQATTLRPSIKVTRAVVESAKPAIASTRVSEVNGVGVVLGLPMRVNGRLYSVTFVASVPDSGREHVHELLDLTLRPVDED